MRRLIPNAGAALGDRRALAGGADEPVVGEPRPAAFRAKPSRI